MQTLTQTLTQTQREGQKKKKERESSLRGFSVLRWPWMARWIKQARSSIHHQARTREGAKGKGRDEVTKKEGSQSQSELIVIG